MICSAVGYTGLGRAGQSLKLWGREERNMEGISQPHPTPNICLLSSSLLPRPGAKAKQTLNLAAPRADRAMEEPPKKEG